METGMQILTDEQITLLQWLNGIINYNHSNRNCDALIKLVKGIDEEKSANIKSTLTIDGKTFSFEMRLGK